LKYLENFGFLILVSVLDELHDKERRVSRFHQADQIVLQLFVQRIPIKYKRDLLKFKKQ
jgi:hypothetical protein